MGEGGGGEICFSLRIIPTENGRKTENGRVARRGKVTPRSLLLTKAVATNIAKISGPSQVVQAFLFVYCDCTHFYTILMFVIFFAVSMKAQTQIQANMIFL